MASGADASPRDGSTRQLRPLLEERAGMFSCAGCGQPLFASKVKFESGTGWPSFNDPIEGAVETSTDRSYAPKSIARIAAAISVTCSTTARRRPACVIASMASRWILSRPIEQQRRCYYGRNNTCSYPSAMLQNVGSYA
jgi:uroporphyrinogen-III decarboxylase